MMNIKKYQIIYADPPWRFRVWSRDTGLGRSAESHYQTMTIEELKDMTLPADDDCALFIWTTPPTFPEALDLIKAWGFEYKTKAFCWVKTNSNSMGLFWGMGYWTRANTEDCILATKGNPKRLNADVHQVVMSQVQEHSRKPSIVREKIVQLMGDLPRIELFARRKVEGWDCWGNEVDSDIDLMSLKEE